MSHAISLINEAQLLTFVPVKGAEIKFRRIAGKRYQDIVRECRIDDRGPTPVDKEQLKAVLNEIIAEDGKFKNVDEAELTKRVYGILLIGQDINKTDWEAVKVRTLTWAISSWSGIGFNQQDGDAPLNAESISAFADTAYGTELFALVLKDVTEQRMKAQGINPLERSGGTLNSASTTAGTTVKRATKTTRKTTASHPALSTKKGSVTTHRKSR